MEHIPCIAQIHTFYGIHMYYARVMLYVWGISQ